MSEIFGAIEAGDGQRVQALLDARPELAEARDERGMSALLFACYRLSPEVAEAIASRKSELDVFEAAALGRLERVRELLDAEPELARAWTSDGFTALHYAAFFDGPQVARLLIERGADVNAVSRHPELIVAPLHSASASRQLDTVRALLDAGADPNAAQPGTFTALHAAGQQGDIEMAELLLARGADRTTATDEGKTAADFASEAGHDELAARLAGLAS